VGVGAEAARTAARFQTFAARAQVVVFRNAGFLAVVTLRIAFYLVWHVAPGLGVG
jgi:hypothetical protein